MAEPSLLEELYREIILDHYRQPRNHKPLAVAATCGAEGSNPLCGDTVTVEVVLDDSRVEDIAFNGNGCSISQASASMMTEFVKGRSVDEAQQGIDAFQQMMTTGEPSELDGFDDIDALIGVAKFPARVKCASLGWKTLEQALAGGGTVTTDDRDADSREDAAS